MTLLSSQLKKLSSLKRRQELLSVCSTIRRWLAREFLVIVRVELIALEEIVIEPWR